MFHLDLLTGSKAIVTSSFFFFLSKANTLSQQNVFVTLNCNFDSFMALLWRNSGHYDVMKEILHIGMLVGFFGFFVLFSLGVSFELRLYERKGLPHSPYGRRSGCFVKWVCPTLSSLTLFSQNFKDQSNEQQHANGLIVSLTSFVNKTSNQPATKPQIKLATNSPFLPNLLSSVESRVAQFYVEHAA